MKGLTDRQKEALDFIERFSRENGFPPALGEISRAMGMSSRAGCHEHILALERKGYLRRQPKTQRGYRLVKAEEPKADVEIKYAALLDVCRRSGFGGDESALVGWLRIRLGRGTFV